MKSLLLGYDISKNQIRLDSKRRKTHTYVIGSSGSGKSKFLESMIRGDLLNRQGFALLDPHGELYDNVVKFCAHEGLKRDIILLNLSEPNQVIGFNPFRKSPKGDVSVQVNRRIEATVRAWGVENTDQTPTLERTLTLIYTILIEKGLSLPLAQYLINFDSKDFRSHLINGLKTPLIRKEWQELQALKRREWRDEVLSAKNRLYRFLTSKTLCRFMGLPDRSIDLKEVMDQGKILLVNLLPSGDLSPENSKVFGTLLMNEFYECAKRRSTKKGQPSPYYLYLDEFQNFVTLDIDNMLDETRKFGLYLILAHQRFGQLDARVLEAALTHSRIKATFGGLTAENAEYMAKELFVGKLDPKKVKFCIYQTKFWPVYTRDKVYGKTTAHGVTSGRGEHSAFGSLTGSASGDFYTPADWFGPQLSGTSSIATSGSSQIAGTSRLEADSYQDAESEIDIPIYKPMPFSELSSVQTYTLEEQLVELTAALKHQFERHCFVQIHHQATQPMLVPFVKDFYTRPSNHRWYVQKQLDRYGALEQCQADALIKEQETALLQEIKATPVAVPTGRKKRKPKQNLFEDLIAAEKSPKYKSNAKKRTKNPPHSEPGEEPPDH